MDELCDRHGDWSTIDFVMKDWEKTNSPLAYWFYEMSGANYQERFKTYTLPDHVISRYSNFSYGLPTEEAIRVCKDKYRRDVVKLTIQIMSPDVMQIRRDMRVTFGDQLAAIGGYMQICMVSLTVFLTRRHSRPLRRSQPNQPRRGRILGL